MDLKKKKAFNQRMGKHKHFPKHQNLAKGGVVKMAGGGVLGSIGSGIQGVAGDFTAQNQYQPVLAPTTQQDYTGVIGGAGQNALGANAQTQNIMAQQQGLSGQLQGIANGTGPNPAQAQLAQSTAANVANQGALMAGQRGAASNVGLMARQAAQQGAATQQQAAGQAATLQSQQQLNALGAIGQQQQNMGALNINQQNANTSLYGTGASANNAQNNTAVSNWGMAQGLQGQVAQNNANAVNQTNSGLMSGIGTAAASIPVIGPALSNLAHGGEVGYDGGGMIPGAQIPAEPNAPEIPNTVLQGELPEKSATPAKKTTTPGGNPNATPTAAAPGGGQISDYTSLPDVAPAAGGNIADYTSLANVAPAAAGAALAHGGSVHPLHDLNHIHEHFSGGGKVPAMVSAKEVYLDPHQVKEVMERGADPMKIGHHFPGKDKVNKDSTKNDVIHTTLDSGGVVLPIHVTTHKDASNRGRQFVAKAVAKHMKRPAGAR